MTTETPAPQHAHGAHTNEPTRRAISGRAFVIACAAFLVAFVLFLVFVSPVLLERTLALAPPPAPQTIASGLVDGRTWSAVAYDGAAHLRGVDEEGIEAVVDEEPCLQVTVAGDEVGEICVLRRGGSIRDLGSVTIGGDGQTLVLGIVAPTVTTVTLTPADGGDLTVTPSYVDFGFPLGFFALEVDAEARVTSATAVDRDGVVRASASCEPSDSPLDRCTVTEGDY